MYKSAKSYMVDCLATTTFYTPFLAASEYFLADMESEEVFKSRLIGMGFHFTIGRPYGWLRQKWADKWNVDKHSSKLKKYAVDTSLFIMVNPPLYAGVLYGIGTSLEETVTALVGATVIGLGTGRPFGWYQDKVRTAAGTKSTLS